MGVDHYNPWGKVGGSTGTKKNPFQVKTKCLPPETWSDFLDFFYIRRGLGTFSLEPYMILHNFKFTKMLYCTKQLT